MSGKCLLIARLHRVMAFDYIAGSLDGDISVGPFECFGIVQEVMNQDCEAVALQHELPRIGESVA
ncbi:MAG: hypothetical protein ABJ381_15595 [Ilumatobacter sp.]|uniref:hypothetical protein n=1 Tax=Ilumatobacter sp. TaxID=1967498 RepID=UPI003298F0D6